MNNQKIKDPYHFIGEMVSSPRCMSFQCHLRGHGNNECSEQMLNVILFFKVSTIFYLNDNS